MPQRQNKKGCHGNVSCDTHNSLCSAAGQLSGDSFNIGLSATTPIVYIPEESEKCQAIFEKTCFTIIPLDATISLNVE